MVADKALIENKTIKNKRVSVIIVNWNGVYWLKQCLPALFEQTYRDFETIIVDNGSTDDSVKWVEEHFPDVTLICNDSNLGFAPANNIGIRASSGEYIVTLNNDTLPASEWLAELVKGISFSVSVGMVASKIILWEQPEILDSTGIEVDWAGIGWNRNWGYPVDTSFISEDVFGPSAAAALYRRNMLEQIGLFDEDFFAYYEDVDLAWRGQTAGWACRYISTAQVYHHHSATSGRDSVLKTFLLNRNKIWAILKNYHWLDMIWAWPLILSSDLISWIFQTVRTQGSTPTRARLQAAKKAKQMLAKRMPRGRRVKLSNFRLRCIP